MLVLILKYTQHIVLVILLDTGTGNKREQLKFKRIVEVKRSDWCLAITALHCFSGCPTIRAFATGAKITLSKVLEKFPEIMDVFGGLSGNLICSATVRDNLGGLVWDSSIFKYKQTQIRFFFTKVPRHIWAGTRWHRLFFFLNAEHYLICMLKVQTTKRIHESMHTNNFQTYQALKGMA